MNVTEIILTNCQIFRLKYTKFNFGWGSAPDPSDSFSTTALYKSIYLLTYLLKLIVLPYIY